MTALLSWHRPGQKVVSISRNPWEAVYPTFWERIFGSERIGPSEGVVVTIGSVHADLDGIWFCLTEYGPRHQFAAYAFRPVYPQVIEQLRKLCAPTPARTEADRVSA